MKPNYVTMGQNTIVVQLSNGPKIVMSHDINFHKIKHAITHNSDEQTVLDLMSPKLEDGKVYRLYVENDKAAVYAVSSIGTSRMFGNYSPITEPLGTFASIADIEDTFPEYFV